MNPCPKCGGPLQAVELDWQTAPWLCKDCGLGFWNAQLTDHGRAMFRHTHNDHGHGPGPRAIYAACIAERDARRDG